MDPFDVLATCAAYSAMKMASLGTEEQLAICVGGAVVLGCALGSKKVRLSASGCTQYRYRQVGCLALMNVSCAAQDDSKDIPCAVGCEVLPCIAAGFVQLTSSLALTDDSPTAAGAALSSGLACCGVATLWRNCRGKPRPKPEAPSAEELADIALRKELKALKKSDLNKRAQAVGIKQKEIDAAEDSENPRAALVELIAASPKQRSQLNAMLLREPADEQPRIKWTKGDTCEVYSAKSAVWCVGRVAAVDESDIDVAYWNQGKQYIRKSIKHDDTATVRRLDREDAHRRELQETQAAARREAQLAAEEQIAAEAEKLARQRSKDEAVQKALAEAQLAKEDGHNVELQRALEKAVSEKESMERALAEKMRIEQEVERQVQIRLEQQKNLRVSRQDYS